MKNSGDDSNIRMPQAEPNGFVLTLNNQGYMTSTVDEYMSGFIEFACQCKHKVVDVGAAYGIATIPAILKGARVIANDIDLRHLEILKRRIPTKYHKNLELLCASFPDGFEFSNNTICAFLISRVVHFFSPEKLEHAVKQLYKWLIPTGKIFLTAETPYLSNLEKFIPIYEERKKKGILWAGYMEDVMKYNPERGKFLPKTMLLLDPDILKYVFETAGFVIEKVAYLPRPEFPADMRRDNRESVGLVCRK